MKGNVAIIGAAGSIGGSISKYMLLNTNKSNVIYGLDSLNGVPSLSNMHAAIEQNRFKFHVTDVHNTSLMKRFFKEFGVSKVLINLDNVGFGNSHYLGCIQGFCKDESVIGFLKNAGAQVVAFKTDANKINLKYNNTICPVISFPNTFGSGQFLSDHGKESIMSRLIYQTLHSDITPSEEVLSRTNEWIYIKDLFNVLLNSFEMNLKNEVYELHTGYVMSNKEVLEALKASMLGVNPELSFEHPEENDIEFSMYEMGSALLHTLKWYQANEWIYK